MLDVVVKAKAVPIFQTAAFEQGAKRAIRAMKDMMTKLQIKCEKLQLEKEQLVKVGRSINVQMSWECRDIF